MSEFQKSTKQVVVANATSAATETTTNTFSADAAVGEVIAVEKDGTAIASGSKEIAIVAKNDNGDLTVSEPIKVADILKVSAKAYSAPTESIKYVGFNGSSNSIHVIENNFYTVNLEMYNFGGTSTELRYRKAGWYQSPAAASQLGIAEGLRDSLIRNFKREPEDRIKFELVASTGSDAALGTSVNNVVFTKGSKFITADDIDDGTGSAALDVGDLLRVGTSATDPVYRITAIDTANNQATLDRTYVGETETIADTGLKFVEADDTSSLKYGVKMTGKELFWSLGKFQYEKFNFTVTLDDCGTTEVTESQASSQGIGAGKRVADDEWFANGNFGELYRMGEPVLYDYRSVLFADSSKKYDVVSIDYLGTTRTGFQENKIQRNITVYCNAGANGTDHTNTNVLITDLNTPSDLSVSTL